MTRKRFFTDIPVVAYVGPDFFFVRGPSYDKIFVHVPISFAL